MLAYKLYNRILAFCYLYMVLSLVKLFLTRFLGYVIIIKNNSAEMLINSGFFVFIRLCSVIGFSRNCVNNGG